MIAYSIVMFAIAVLFLALGVAIYKGNHRLIHDYHQTHVRESERQSYCKGIAKGMFTICATLVISGMIALFDKQGTIVVASVSVLLVGLVVAFIILGKVQKKYNGGF